MSKVKATTPRSIPGRMSNSRVFIDNAQLDAEIGKMMAVFGYDKKELKAGQMLLEDSEKTETEFDDTHGKKLSVTKRMNKKWDAADAKFSITRQVTNLVVGKDPGEKKALALNGRRAEALPLWLRQANSLYTNLLKSKKRLDKMAKRGYTKAKLEAEYKLVKEIEKLDSQQENIKGSAQTFTKIRNKKMKALDEWMAQAKKYARIALAEKPQLMEKLGITIES